MSYDIQVRDVQPGLLAVARGRATTATLGQQITALSNQVYTFLKKGTVQQEGHNVVVYLNGPSEAEQHLLATPQGCPIEVGVQVGRPFEGDGNIVCSSTPGGTVATVVHRGPYDELVDAHIALHGWSAENHRPFAGPNWEVYGDWSDQPENLRTDVYYLLLPR